MWTNTTDGINWRDNLHSENYKLLQKSKKFKIGEGSSLKGRNRGKTNIETESFISKNICDNE